MKNLTACLLSALVLASMIPAASATAGDDESSTVPAQEEEAATPCECDTLVGQWRRPDGGYLITIRSVTPDGELDAAYENPQPLPFAVAQATRNDEVIDLFFELRAGGYNGSTYTLRYDPEVDVLFGIYYQAVARQEYQVYFQRVH